MHIFAAVVNHEIYVHTAFLSKSVSRFYVYLLLSIYLNHFLTFIQSLS